MAVMVVIPPKKSILPRRAATIFTVYTVFWVHRASRVFPRSLSLFFSLFLPDIPARARARDGRSHGNPLATCCMHAYERGVRLLAAHRSNRLRRKVGGRTELPFLPPVNRGYIY